MKKTLLSTPHMSGNELSYINQAFKSNWIAPLGPNVDHFEKELAEYSKARGALATISGTAAIHLALDVLGIKKGDTVYCSTFTFVASANPVLYLGGRVEFIDSETETWNMSPDALEFALNKAKRQGTLPKAIIIVNLYGQSAKMDELIAIANSYRVPVVEDAAESLGSEYKGKKSGTFGNIGIFSFNGNKIITTSGGGALLSDDEELLNKARFLATQAKDPALYYQHTRIGYNYRMSNILAGIGRAQLTVLDERVQRRREIFSLYEKELGTIEGIHFMPELNQTMSNRWLTTMTIDPQIISIHPFEIIYHLNLVGIETRALWKPLHLQPLYSQSAFYTHKNNQQAVSEQLFATGLCLPSGTNMSEEEQYRVIEQLKILLLLSKRNLFVQNKRLKKETYFLK